MSPGKHYRPGGRWIEIAITVVIALLAVGGGLAGYLIGKGKNTESGPKPANQSSSSSTSAPKTIYVPGYTDPIPVLKNTSNGWEIDFSIPKTKFRRGEPIDFKLSIKNITDQEALLTFNTAQKYDLEARDADGNKVWQWSEGQMFAAMLSQETLGPGKTLDFSVFWSQLNNQKKQVLLGKYYIVANITANEVSANKVAVELEIAE